MLEPDVVGTRPTRERIPRYINIFDLRPGRLGPALRSVVGWWWLVVEGVVPPPVGAFAGGPAVGRHGRRGFRGWAGQRARVQVSSGAVGDGEPVGGPADGDDTAVVQPVMATTGRTTL